MTQLFELDFDAVEEGATFETAARTVDQDDIASFATLTGDLHPQHVDPVWSGRSPFGGRIAHGLLVISFAAGLVPVDPDRIAALRGVRDVVFKRPVYPGDAIHVDGRVEACRPLDENLGRVTMQWRIVNQRGEIVARARAEVLWRREASGLLNHAAGVMPL
jgi:acyl dehydratase